MKNDDIKSLCLLLMKADKEDDVVAILKERGYWDRPECWRYYGDTQDNYSAAGSQANEAETALIEKITNSRDARLMLQCYLAGIDPKGNNAPKSLKEAVGKFFKVEEGSDVEGDLASIDSKFRTELARGMTLALTGSKPGKTKYDGFPSLTIVDDGEGQTPDSLPDTILSLNRSIKNEIEFAHGKFNMGGTAPLTFCGDKNIQLVISKRHSELVTSRMNNPTERDTEWGFTIVKREFPEGKRRKSWYKFLAPIPNPSDTEKPRILSFKADKLPLFPMNNQPYARETAWGTLIKLYEYQTKFRTQAMREGGLRGVLDLLLPEIGLPLRVHECREGYGGHKGSFDNNVNGLMVRLSDDNETLELKEPLTEKINLHGQVFEMSIYVFKSKDVARTYRRKDKALLFCVNGQAQGWEPERFFDRKGVKKAYLKDSLLVFVDCSKIDATTQELLFSNSRDRLSTKRIKEELLEEIEDSLKENSVLKELHEQRKREKTAEKLSNSKPLGEVLKSVIKNNSSLSSLFNLGNIALGTFRARKVDVDKKPFEGKRFPTFFNFHKMDEGSIAEKHCHINLRCRVKFDTDAQNDYFKRENSHGEFSLFRIIDGEEVPYEGNYKANLTNGHTTLNLSLPENVEVGDKLEFISKVTDPSRLFNPFLNRLNIYVLKEHIDDEIKPRKDRDDFPDDKPGNKEQKSGGIGTPENIIEVAKESSEKQISWEEVPGDSFTANSALAIISNGEEENPYKANGYDWYINVENKYLVNELKNSPDDADIIQGQYKYGMILMGVSMLHEESTTSKDQSTNGDEPELSLQDKVIMFSSSISPVLVPMINELSKIREPQLNE